MNVNGIDTTLQIGKESVWGTKVTATQNINFLSESFKMEPEFIEEDSVIGSISARDKDIAAFNVSGGYDSILKPENAVSFFALALGLQAAPVTHDGATVAKDHVITPVGANVALPSFTAIVDRKLHVKAYAGCQVGTFEISAKSKDYIRTKVTAICKSEETGTITTLPKPSKKAYKFVNGVCAIDGTPFADVTNVVFSGNNAATVGDHTLGSGLLPSEGGHGIREYSVTLDTKFNAAANSLIETKYKTGDTVEVELTFESPEEIEAGIKHQFEISLPAVLINGGLPNINGKEDLTVSITGVALEKDGVSPCTVTVVSDIATIF